MPETALKQAFVDPNLQSEYPLLYKDIVVETRFPYHQRSKVKNDPRSFSEYDHICHLRSSNYDYSYSEEEWSKVLQQREQTRLELVSRGYDIISDAQQSDYDLSRTLGFPINKEWYPSHAWIRRPILNTLWGMVEAPHVPILLDVLKRSTQRDIKAVLDLGCGFMSDTKAKYEDNAASMIYLDNSEDILKKLDSDLQKYGKPKYERTFICADKDSLTDALRPESISAVIRTGVREANDLEMKGLSDVLSPYGQVFVSNSIPRQPIHDFLDHTEKYFTQIKVHVGYDRYSLVLGK